MALQLSYWLFLIACLPLLPLLIRQGKRVRATVPRLPEAQNDRNGVAGEGPPTLTLLTIGESTFAGVGVHSHRDCVTGQLAQALSESLGRAVQWQVFAKSGYTAKSACEKLLPEIGEHPYDLIVIGLGGNDAFRLNTPRRWQRHLQELVQGIRGRGQQAPIVFANMPPIGQFPAFPRLLQFFMGNLVTLLGKAARQFANVNENTYFIDQPIRLEEWTRRTDQASSVNDFFSDGVHPSGLTYALWAREIADYIGEHRILDAKRSST